MITINSQDIEKEVTLICEYFGIEESSLFINKKMYLNVTEARFCLTYLLHKEYRIPANALARLFNTTQRNIYERCNNVDNVFFYTDIYKDMIKKVPQLLEDEELEKYTYKRN